MPQEPKKKHSKGRKRTRRAAISLEAISLVKCSHCQAPTPSHVTCRSCGFYAGKQVNQKTTAVITKA
ncbi:50S ribosomal protein L32 [Candidatus Daviesbacteria bacterium RIFCSPLOWO2_02_FULL_40_8]|uniref:Large ribosomal subunit protein bL32 n=1 Tax=Candidatus Daviesbacteria bacterium RIFCSPLOWO2_01_FULL_40_24 TaxID=1797787 RepID=A0A1F5MIU4_9BACT|nr:MAG: 50S ribosomal protein L32 [Candidatus Daviesbacteria bacterium RIFCSPHIGHO2_01_FULL_41_45]OGE35552.1 MAG: 50S ribosomal protein L32 [Candidatus Daviesbacteria bacterium RIFCSPHIGHO2_02_FULL_41_14]OGE65301.1 MAG: 50S ribosomal protein L32 [Candidatus Daviesbacteria bacterium RIFCSPLOWO2_01_FULL_40_24]OGE66949.1 MAG: 50S ribosomal protein L32 [Candidatus Daviesbacteria bacterium RIFCSPLOWO2_02_FULL_40_8]